MCDQHRTADSLVSIVGEKLSNLSAPRRGGDTVVHEKKQSYYGGP